MYRNFHQINLTRYLCKTKLSNSFHWTSWWAYLFVDNECWTLDRDGYLLRFTGITALRVMATGQMKHMICTNMTRRRSKDIQTNESNAVAVIISFIHLYAAVWFNEQRTTNNEHVSLYCFSCRIYLAHSWIPWTVRLMDTEWMSWCVCVWVCMCQQRAPFSFAFY